MLMLRFILSAFAPALQNAEQTKLAALGQVSALNYCRLVHVYICINYICVYV